MESSVAESEFAMISLFRACLFTVIIVFGAAFNAYGANRPSFYRQVQGSESVIVFVHGLFGDSQSTWTSKNNSFWPKLLAEDEFFKDYSIYLYEYNSSLSSNVLSIDEIAENMRIFLNVDGVAARKDIIFIAHSMGGLVTRAYLLKNRAVAANTRMAYFYSTPTNGSELAAIVELLHSNPEISKLQPMKSSEYLADLERQWLAAKIEIPSFCAYETLPTFGVNVVTQASATNLCNRPLDPIEADHISIVKPDDARDLRYLSFKAAVLETPKREMTNASSDMSKIDERLKRLEAALVNPDKSHVSDFAKNEDIESRYPLGYGVFYSDGKKNLYFAGNVDPNVYFDASSINVTRSGPDYMCVAGINTRLYGDVITNLRACLGTAPGSIGHLIKSNDGELIVESLGKIGDRTAMVVGVRGAH